ncbi:PIN domain protein [Treponema socranskii subsp. socranskii VPI DR56BR1116 = ATCC 35536]|jgi:PIN domain protein|uniref:PIN domain protein n=1 Tax=Treponema socranskii subsp. socranskii VPI DR56BR1116 = ATCC 35536 TaxID=1125725 RepID=U2MSG6_TRESO|nr:PIN domain-containing protein [Treponema socranskii]ERF61399.1 PIN domain protein [Treponema socranskii subsp. socranskii VPI DR56BR1116 = ATCC 35536]ERK04580.1 PIN domain protein [Treponema socranskii subsp. socranskii VPI DR56BR1116 = ATCC 35536]UTD03807.1 PIN domain-containing protein [Treponema socranskii subsp. buccale]
MILVDTSVWINYFKGREEVKRLDTFIETNSIVVNDLILAELLPFINQKKEYELRNLLLNIEKVVLHINWNEIIKMQTENLKNGINKVGVPDLVIAQNVIQHNLYLYSMDKHFKFMSKLFPIKLIEF